MSVENKVGENCNDCFDEQAEIESYPECRKLANVAGQKSIIEDFLDWCQQQGYELRDWNSTYLDQPQSITINREELLADYFGIDAARLEKERVDILKKLKEQS